MSSLALIVLGPLNAVPLLTGDFHGLEVLEPYSDDPVIITTQKLLGFTVVNMIGEFGNLVDFFS